MYRCIINANGAQAPNGGEARSGKRSCGAAAAVFVGHTGFFHFRVPHPHPAITASSAA